MQKEILINKLEQIGVSNPRLEADILLEYMASHEANMDSLIAKRKEGVPLCKIVGHKGFYKHDFIVSEDVLSPRADTEVLVEKAIELLKNNEKPNILELGIGSGCILLSILGDVPKATGVGIDISEKALKITSQNIKLMNMENRTEILQSSWFDDYLAKKIDKKFDMIVSNPPYIPSSDILELDRGVKNYDPMLALDGGVDGLRDYRQIAKISKNLLLSEGYILLEVGISQYKDVIDIFEKQDFKLEEIVKDLAGIERCLVFKFY